MPPTAHAHRRREVAYFRLSWSECEMVCFCSGGPAICNHLFRSPPINIEDIGEVSFRLPLAASDEHHLVNANIKIEGSTIFIYLNRATEGWPFKIENHSSYKFTFMQTVSNCFLSKAVDSKTEQDRKYLESDNPPANTNPVYTLSPSQELSYAWDFPAAREKRLSLKIGGARREVDIMEIGNLVPFRFNVRSTFLSIFV